MKLRRPAPQDRARLIMLVALSAALGGLVGWIAAFFLGARWLLLGAAVTIGMVAVLTRRDPGARPLGFMAGYTFAFVVLTWPIMALPAALVWAAITGQSLGS